MRSDWRAAVLAWTVTPEGSALRVTLSAPGTTGFTKSYRFTESGLEEVTFTWPASDDDGGWFVTEASHEGRLDLQGDPPPEHWTYPIETVAKSERGLERTLQGTATVLRWPARLGTARVRMAPAR
jgi:hypothetical protein